MGTKHLLKSPKKRDNSEDVDMDRRIILKWKWGFGCGLDSSGTGQALVAGCYEHVMYIHAPQKADN
jgi:hypothetical protein